MGQGGREACVRFARQGVGARRRKQHGAQAREHNEAAGKQARKVERKGGAHDGLVGEELAQAGDRAGLAQLVPSGLAGIKAYQPGGQAWRGGGGAGACAGRDTERCCPCACPSRCCCLLLLLTRVVVHLPVHAVGKQLGGGHPQHASNGEAELTEACGQRVGGRVSVEGGKGARACVPRVRLPCASAGCCLRRGRARGGEAVPLTPRDEVHRHASSLQRLNQFPGPLWVCGMCVRVCVCVWGGGGL